MARVVDITDKLSFDENPAIRIRGEELEIQSDAENMIRMIGLFESGTSEMKAVTEAADMLFSSQDMKKLKKMKLQIKDFMEVVRLAIDIAMEEDESQGEQ